MLWSRLGNSWPTLTQKTSEFFSNQYSSTEAFTQKIILFSMRWEAEAQFREFYHVNLINFNFPGGGGGPDSPPLTTKLFHDIVKKKRFVMSDMTTELMCLANKLMDSGISNVVVRSLNHRPWMVLQPHKDVWRDSVKK